MLSQANAAPVKATGNSEPMFSKVQPCVVIKAPELNDVTVIVTYTTVSIAAWAVVFSSGA